MKWWPAWPTFCLRGPTLLRARGKIEDPLLVAQAHQVRKVAMALAPLGVVAEIAPLLQIVRVEATDGVGLAARLPGLTNAHAPLGVIAEHAPLTVGTSQSLLTATCCSTTIEIEQKS